MRTLQSMRVALVFPVLLWNVTAGAQMHDPAAARTLAKEAYELKLSQNWEQARLKFEESERLDPSAKTLINLAECEEHLGRLTGAEKHLVDARDMLGDDNELRGIAVERLAIVEARMPRLVISLAPGAPADTTIVRDGVLLNAPSRGVSLPTDPGRHVINVSAPGFQVHVFEVDLREQEVREVEVTPGDPLEASRHPTPKAVESGPAAMQPSSRGALPVVGLATAGVGIVSMGIGAAFGISAKYLGEASHCVNNVCANDGDRQRLENAKWTAYLSTGFFITGGVMAGGGIALWLFAPRARSSASSSSVAVSFDGRGGVVAKGSW